MPFLSIKGKEYQMRHEAFPDALFYQFPFELVLVVPLSQGILES